MAGRSNREPSGDDKLDWQSLRSLLEDDDRRAAIQHEFPKIERQSFLAALRQFGDPSAAGGSFNNPPPSRHSVDSRSGGDRSAGSYSAGNQSLADDLLAAGRKFDTAARLGDWPTIAVAGMLNGGKTTLVSTFLSPAGRQRTLRGASNAEGTHRFVLWLPESWRGKSDLWELLLQRIGDAVGGAVEMLADDVAGAHRQYNNDGGDAETLRVPLVATDPALDEFGVGLLDCPDIVSDEAFGLGSPQQRRELLGRAATLCSAFLVVASAESSRDSTLGDLMRIASDLMPGVPRMLAVNKVRPRQSPDEVHEAFSPLANAHGVETIYAAYDFEIAGWEKFDPSGPVRSDDRPAADPMPVFFEVSADAGNNPPADIDPRRLLSHLPERLDRARLFENFRRALQASLRNMLWRRCVVALEDRTSLSEHQTVAARDCLLDAASEFFVKSDFGEAVDLRLVQNRRVVRQLSESFIATAPWYARWGVQLNAKIRGAIGGASRIGRRFSPGSMLDEAGENVRQKFRDGELDVLSPDRLATAIDRHGGHSRLPHWDGASGWVNHDPAATGSDSSDSAGGSPQRAKASAIDDRALDRSLYREAAEAAILRFERDGATSLDPRRLDELTAQMWSEISTGQKLKAGLTPLAAATAAFGAVLLVPVDFGASAVGLASIPELFGAFGLTVFAQNWAGKQNLRNVELQAAKQQLSDFLAVLCDTFGVQRPTTPPTIRLAGVAQRLGESKITTREPFEPGRVLPLMRMRREFTEELRRVCSPQSRDTISDSESQQGSQQGRRPAVAPERRL